MDHNAMQAWKHYSCNQTNDRNWIRIPIQWQSLLLLSSKRIGSRIQRNIWTSQNKNIYFTIVFWSPLQRFFYSSFQHLQVPFIPITTDMILPTTGLSAFPCWKGKHLTKIFGITKVQYYILFRQSEHYTARIMRRFQWYFCCKFFQPFSQFL